MCGHKRSIFSTKVFAIKFWRCGITWGLTFSHTKFTGVHHTYTHLHLFESLIMKFIVNSTYYSGYYRWNGILVYFRFKRWSTFRISISKWSNLMRITRETPKPRVFVPIWNSFDLRVGLIDVGHLVSGKLEWRNMYKFSFGAELCQKCF